MTRVCTVCSHPKRKEIERIYTQARACNVSALATQYGFDRSTLQRHIKLHLGPRLKKAQKRAEMEDLDLVKESAWLFEHAKSQVEQYTTGVRDDAKVAADFSRTARLHIDTQAKLRGSYKQPEGAAPDDVKVGILEILARDPALLAEVEKMIRGRK